MMYAHVYHDTFYIRMFFTDGPMLGERRWFPLLISSHVIMLSE